MIHPVASQMLFDMFIFLGVPFHLHDSGLSIESLQGSDFIFTIVEFHFYKFVNYK